MLNLNRIQQLICQNPALQAELKNSNSQEHFMQRLSQIAQTNGISTTLEHLKDTISTSQSFGMVVLDDEALEAVAGGVGFGTRGQKPGSTCDLTSELENPFCKPK